MIAQETRILNLIKENDALIAHVGRSLGGLGIPASGPASPEAIAFGKLSHQGNTPGSSPSND